MSHRTARLLKPVLRLLRRPHRGAVSAAPEQRGCWCLDSSLVDAPHLSGPTVHHTGYRPPTPPATIAVFGIGMGSCGMLAARTEAAR
ncbi:hypothetical protein [Streptomyces sp. NPDC054783]